MSKKTLNKVNLGNLGADKLADLVLDLVLGNAALQRRARMELSAALGPKDVAADIRKRFASLRRSTSFVDWRKQRALVKDLEGLVAMIETSVAPHDADEAFELLWSFLLLAPAIHERTDDSNGAIGGVLSEVVDLIAKVSPKISVNGPTLADRILDAVVDAGYGEFDGIIPATSDALGDEGLEHLKKITNNWVKEPPTAYELKQYEGYTWSSTSPEERVLGNKKSTRSIILADIADAQGDVDAYMAGYSKEQLTFGTIAPDVARRLLDADRVDEAVNLIERARAADSDNSFRMFRYDLDEVYEECLRRLGKTEELKKHFLNVFEQTLRENSLREYLKMLPDFEDFEAEERALDYVETYPHIGGAINFLIEWPAHERASKTVLARVGDLNGNSYGKLTDAAEALDGKYHLAATLMRRAMILDTLEGGKSKRYRYAAKHLAECAATDGIITDYQNFPTHTEFTNTLKEKHGRKYGFWSLT